MDTARFKRALTEAVSGEVRFDLQAKGLYSTDASQYRQIPVGVVIPRSLEDVENAVAVCRQFDVPVTSRGGGTSLAGQCCNVSVIIDFSKYLNRIIEIDAEQRTAWVEPGCVLDDLRDAAQEHGLTFGPDPSTHNHNTLGGMIGNNSCGVHSIMAGRTVDNVEALEILTFEGLKLTAGPMTDAELEVLCGEEGPRGDIYRALCALRDRYSALIRERYPDIPRRVSGYNVDELLAENGFHVARALVGCEGTCVVILRAKLRLVPSAPRRALVVLGYESVYEAADAVPSVMEHQPLGLEGIDDKLVLFMKSKGMHSAQRALLPDGDGWLLVEFGGESGEEAAAKAQALADEVGRECREVRIIDDPSEAQKIWEVRKAGLAATAHVPLMGDTHPGWEDAAIPPPRLGAYLRHFRKLLDRYGYECALYGHFGDGCVHCRIDFDFKTLSGVNAYLAFIHDAAELVSSFGGSLSGEHGDGQSRAALLKIMYGQEIIEVFRAFKAIWDPRGRMNPGKLVDAWRPDENLRTGPDYRPWTASTRFAYPEDRGDFARSAARCVGVGECRKHSSGVMCPSYRATYEEAYSTRGRARMLFEMMRGDLVRDGWKSEAVKESLEFCLACKACKTECPVNVDMATYKAEFMHSHYRWRLRPRDSYAMGLIWWWARAGSNFPRAVNVVLRSPMLSPVLKWLGGITPRLDFPSFAETPFRKWFAASAHVPSGKAQRGPEQGRLRPRHGCARVVLWPDTFNGYFTPAPLQAAAQVLAGAGYEVEIPARPLCCGRPLYGPGMISLASRLWRRNLQELQPYIRTGTPIVMVEPACASAFRDELPNLFPKEEDALRLSRQVKLLSEFLYEEGFCPPRMEGQAVVHGHCHHSAILGMEAEIALLEKTGLEVQKLDGTCCGMAGDFGFRKKTHEVAIKAGECSFLPAVRRTPENTLFIADGFSCREQARQAAGRRLTTFSEVLDEAMARERSAWTVPH